MARMLEFSVWEELVNAKISQCLARKKNQRFKITLIKGMAIAKRLVNFGTNKIMYTNRKPSEEASRLGYEFVESDVLLNKSDFLVCACAANKETERYFDLAKFKKMKRDAIFINISRGSVVNQEDLVVALKENLISAAGFKHFFFRVFFF